MGNINYLKVSHIILLCAKPFQLQLPIHITVSFFVFWTVHFLKVNEKTNKCMVRILLIQ
jgi:hypothetical protein